MRILLADDDHDQLELRSLLLTRSGYETIPVTTTAAALLAAEEQWPECAVLDLKLPTEAMGLSLIRALKSLDAAMRIFVLTGSDPKRINALPEKKLVEEVIVKGSSTAYLMKKLGELAGSAEPKLALFRETLARLRRQSRPPRRPQRGRWRHHRRRHESATRRRPRQRQSQRRTARRLGRLVPSPQIKRRNRPRRNLPAQTPSRLEMSTEAMLIGYKRSRLMNVTSVDASLAAVSGVSLQRWRCRMPQPTLNQRRHLVAARDPTP